MATGGGASLMRGGASEPRVRSSGSRVHRSLGGAEDNFRFNWIGEKDEGRPNNYVITTLSFFHVFTWFWFVVAERSSSPNPTSGVVSSSMGSVMTLLPLSKALGHNCFIKYGKVVHSAPSTCSTRLLLDDTHAYILMDCEGGNPISGLGRNVPLW